MSLSVVIGLRKNTTWCLALIAANSCLSFYLLGQKYSKHMFINTPKSWRDAQTYCRQHQSELVSVRNEEENRQIQQLIPAGSVTYIGLFKDAFVWSDDSTTSFRNWGSGQLDGSGECVVHLRQNRLWDDVQCSDAMPFFCYDSECFSMSDVFFGPGGPPPPYNRYIYIYMIYTTIQKFLNSKIF